MRSCKVISFSGSSLNHATNANIKFFKSLTMPDLNILRLLGYKRKNRAILDIKRKRRKDYTDNKRLREIWIEKFNSKKIS